MQYCVSGKASQYLAVAPGPVAHRLATQCVLAIAVWRGCYLGSAHVDTEVAQEARNQSRYGA